MNKAYIYKLLRKFVEKDLSDEEFLELKEILADHKFEPLILELMESEWETFTPVINLSPARSEYLYNQIITDKRFTQLQNDKKSRFRMLTKRIAVAACTVLAVFALSIVAYKYNQINTPTYVLYKAPLGERILRLLPDGSKVWLNAGTTIRIIKDFKGKTREVFLEGEAFFDVIHDQKPFVIHTGTLTTQVLGTAFNVSAYPEKNISVVVLRGKVGVKDTRHLIGFVKPNEELEYDVLTKASKSLQVNAALYSSWTKGELEFNDVNMEEAAEILSRWYNVKIAFKDEGIKTSRFVASFPANTSLTQVINIISKLNKFKYEVNKNIIYLSRQGNN
ncbi:FecR family protein [Pedobacter rhodius]|uniref:DUF4974 domain-containing protein n=1 Tax=Pedobacter rhodius TaxID=3004098 RepID=A0ABT4KUL7_9SPHI|nr:FecR domain-containing protein [Pedobacter sp. SJ11]MCZ4222635.1 DUF4974 domain-containing protein [Pedobacter sp. SJ11]